MIDTDRSMLDVLQGFVQELRAAGLPVSMTENLDAMRATEHIPFDDRDAFKAALGATLGEAPRALERVRDRVRRLLLALQPGRRRGVGGAAPKAPTPRTATASSSARPATVAAPWAT